MNYIKSIWKYIRPSGGDRNTLTNSYGLSDISRENIVNSCFPVFVKVDKLDDIPTILLSLNKLTKSGEDLNTYLSSLSKGVIHDVYSAIIVDYEKILNFDKFDHLVENINNIKTSINLNDYSDLVIRSTYLPDSSYIRFHVSKPIFFCKLITLI